MDLMGFYSAVMHREQLSSTEALPQLSLAVGRSAEPLPWFAADGTRIRMVFLCAVPESAAGAYLGLVSALARLSRSPDRVERLFQAPDSESLLAVLDEVQVREPRPAVLVS